MSLYRMVAIALMGLSAVALSPVGLVLAQQPAGTETPDVGAPVSPPLLESQPASRLFRAVDLMSPLSRARWGSFSLYSSQIQVGYATRPFLGTSLETANLGFFASRPTGVIQANSAMGFSRRWNRGGFSFTYSPSIYRQMQSGLNQSTHALGIHYERAIGSRWQLALFGNGGTYNQYTFLLKDHPIENIARLRVPMSNLDLLDILDQPQQLNLTPPEHVLSGRGVLRGTAGLSLTRKLGQHNHLLFSGNYGLNRTLDPETGTGGFVPAYRANNLLLDISLSHSFSPHHQAGVAVGEQRSMRASASSRRLRQVRASYNWLPSPRWSIHVSGGPGIMNTALPGRQLIATGAATIARLGSYSMTSATYSRGMYIGEINSGSQAQLLNVAWSPRPRQRQHLLYSLSAGYQWVRSAAGGMAVEGWSVRPTLAIPVNNSLQLFSQYVFFNQHWGRVATTSSLANIQRHMVLFGLRWNFQAGPGVFQADPGMRP